jgi:hypothetical protein
VTNIKHIARQLGGSVASKNSITMPGPNHSPRDRSLSVLFKADGFIVHSFTGDDWRICREHVQQLLGQSDYAAPTNLRAKDDNTKLALQLWAGARDPIGTVAETYLNGRGLVLPGELRRTALRFEARCAWGSDAGKTHHPALVAPFRSIKDGRVVAVLRIALTDVGQKIGRRMLGPIDGAAVVLDKVEGDELYIAEGLETALAARQLGMQPVWACGSAIGIGNFPIIARINTLHILGENDAASDAAILACGERWRRAGKKVHAWFPEHGGDFNDELLERLNARAE